MRTARFSWVLLPLAAFVVLPPSPVIASPASLDQAPPRPAVATLCLAADTLAVTYVGSWGLGVVRYELPDRTLGYLSTHKIARVVDAEGRDRTRHVLIERRSLGGLSDGLAPRFDRWIVSPFEHSPTRRAPGYAVTEVSALGVLGEGGVTGSGASYSIGFGAAKNLSATWSLGGVVHLNAGDNEYRGADVGVRLRRYFSDHLSVETSQGILHGSTRRGGNWETHGLAYWGEAALTVSDAVSLVVRAESAEWRSRPSAVYRPLDGAWQYGPGSQRTTERPWRIGVRVGPYPSWLSVPALVAASLLFLVPRPTVTY